jgi:GNAT superfamily N-acetyltransferase
MLVKLYDLPALEPAIAAQRATGISIRRCMPPEKFLVLDWIREHFSEYWVSEADVGFSVHPTTVMLAHRGNQLLGFACYDTTYKNFFGPTGVDAAERGRGIGAALLLATLHAMRDAGYMYAIVGGAGPVGYYEKVGATVIPDSEPSRAYLGMLGTDAVYTRGASSDSFLDMEPINHA